MSAIEATKIIRLYRDLLRYGNQLKFTDKNFFKNRVREEFRTNQSLNSATDIEFYFKVSFSFTYIFVIPISVNGISFPERTSTSEKKSRSVIFIHKCFFVISPEIYF